MPIQFDCPACGKRLKAPDAKAGAMAKCPYCLDQIQVPEPIYEVEEIVPREEAPEAGHYALREEAEAPAEKDRRPCPMCGEMIKDTAVKCRYCGEIFDPTLRRIEKKKKKKYSETDSDLTVGEYVLAILCANIGCIVSIVWMIQGKPKGTKMFAFSMIGQVVWFIIGLFLGALGDH